MTYEPYFAEGTPAMVELDKMVDRAGLRNVLFALAHIANAKAEHIDANWQDKFLADQWTDRAVLIQRLANRVRNITTARPKRAA